MIKTAFANLRTESGPGRHVSKGMLASPCLRLIVGHPTIRFLCMSPRH
jgi:hypothetical protein